MSALSLINSLIAVVQFKVDNIETQKKQFKHELSFEQEIIRTKDIYKKHITTWSIDGSYTQLLDINILYCLTLSRIERSNLLLNLIDSYRRDNIADLIQNTGKINTEQDKIQEWISSRPFVKEIQDKIQNTKLNFAEIYAGLGNEEAVNTKNKKCQLDLKSLLQTYPRRIAPGFELCDRLINGNLEAVSKWLVVSSQFVHLLIDKETKGIGGPPCLIDFIILLNPAIDNEDILTQNNNENDDTDDDDDLDALMDDLIESTENVSSTNDIIGNFIAHLRQTNCKLSQTKFCDVTDEKDAFDACRLLKEAFSELREQINSDHGSYPMNRRFNLIIDTRYSDDNPDQKDTVIVFEPPADCNKLSDVSVPECYFDLSRLCLIPRPGYGQNQKHKSEIEKLKQETITTQTSSQGQILTLSYHIWAADEIKCYLFWNGLCHRFYPQDILELLPYMFRKDSKNADFAASAEAKELIAKMSINDAKFETFYSKVNGLNKFPKIQ